MRTVIVALFLLVAGFCAWLAFGRDATAALPGVPDAVGEGAPRGGVPIDASPAPSIAPETTREQVDAAPGEPGNEAPPIPADAKWIEIRVIDGETRQPAPGVDVWWGDETLWQLMARLPKAELRADRRDEDAKWRRFGWHTRTNADGKARVTTGKHGVTVVANDATRYGAAYLNTDLEAPPGGHVIELAVDCTITVHVRDAADNDAAGVPVALLQHDPDGEKPRFDADGALQTDERGIVTFRHVQNLRRWRSGLRAGEPVETFALGVAIPRLAIEPIFVDAAAMPREPIEMQLPATGSLTVRPVFDGRPLPLDGELLIRPGPLDDAMARNENFARPADDAGWTHFAYLPLGMTWCVGNFHWEVPVDGPTRPGEDLRTTIELAELVYALSGRVLLPDGTPLASSSVRVEYRATTSGGGTELSTDEQGRFFWIVSAPRGRDRPVEITQLAMSATGPDGTRTRSDVPPRTLARGRNDIGDVRLGDGSMIVSGRLVFDCGNPKPTHVSIRRKQEGGRRGMFGDNRRVDVNADGSFELRGSVEPGAYELTVSGFSHLPVEPVEFMPGTTGLEIHVSCGNQVEASCLLPDGVDGNSLRLCMVVPGAAPARDAMGMTLHLDPMRAQPHGPDKSNRQRCRFLWPALPNGTFTLRVTGASNAALVEIPDVVLPLPPGGDDRLTDIDLRALVTNLRLKVHVDPALDADGTQDLMAFVLPVPDTDDWHGRMIQRDGTVLLVPPGPIDLMVFHHGGRSTTLHGVEGEAEATLEAWSTAELSFTGIGEQADDVRLLVGVRQQRPDPRTRDDRRYVTDRRSGMLGNLLRTSTRDVAIEDGKASVPMPANVETLRVLVAVGRRQQILEQVEPQQIVAGQHTTVQLSADEIRRVADELRAKNQKD